MHKLESRKTLGCGVDQSIRVHLPLDVYFVVTSDDPRIFKHAKAVDLCVSNIAFLHVNRFRDPL